MDENKLSSAAGDALRKYRHSDEPDDETLHTRRVHVVAGATVLAGTTATIVGIGLAIVGLFSKPPAVPPASGWTFFGGLITLAAAKLICLADRGRLVGAKPIRTALVSDLVAVCGLAYLYVDPYGNRIFSIAPLGFVFSMAVFAFYWKEAAGSLRLPSWQSLINQAMIGFLVTSAIGFLVMVQISNRKSDASDRLIDFLTLLSALGALIVTLVLWCWGLTGLVRELIRTGDSLPRGPGGLPLR